jgi:iron complex outermembrane recepter protein
MRSSRAIAGNSTRVAKFVLLLMSFVTATRAQEQPTEVLAEVTVTAQKREQRLQDVGTSITALDGSQLTQLGMTSTTDVARQVPGMQVNQYSPTITTFNIRGVNQTDFSDFQESPVAVYSDDAYVASMGAVAGSMFDLQRVEVLRGPQGTLFGRNATGGLVQYLSNPPTNDADAQLSVTGGRFADIESEGYVNGPVADDIAARLSFATSDHDGFVHNRIGPDAGTQHQYAARLQFLVKPADAGSILVKLYGIRNVNEVPQGYAHRTAIPDAQGLGVFVGPNENPYGTCPGCDPMGYRNPSSDVFDQAFDRRGVFDRALYGATAKVSWDFAPFSFTSVSDYAHMRKRYGEDTDASPNDYFTYDTFQRFQQFSEELRLNGGTDVFRWISGLYYLNLKSDSTANIALPPYSLYSGNTTSIGTSSWAAFGQLERDFLEHWTAIVGVRYSSDHKTDHYLFNVRGDPTQTVDYNPSTFPSADRTFNNESGKIELDYKPSRDFLLYGSVNRGTKGGGWAAPVAGPVEPATLGYKQEELTNYETGYKTSWLDGRARLNGALFYYDYRNYQAFFFQNLVEVIGNRDATVRGGELELSMIPLSGFELQTGVSGLDTRVKNIVLPDGEVVDRVLPQAPKWSVNALARYERSVWGGKVSVSADTKWNTSQYFTSFNAPVDFESGYAVTNIRTAYTTADGAWTIAAFCRNVADRRYRAYDLDVSSSGFSLNVFGPPRWWGLTVERHWGP